MSDPVLFTPRVPNLNLPRSHDLYRLAAKASVWTFVCQYIFAPFGAVIRCFGFYVGPESRCRDGFRWRLEY